MSYIFLALFKLHATARCCFARMSRKTIILIDRLILMILSIFVLYNNYKAIPRSSFCKRVSFLKAIFLFGPSCIPNLMLHCLSICPSIISFFSLQLCSHYVTESIGDASGVTYTGKISVTVSETECQRWDSQLPTQS